MNNKIFNHKKSYFNVSKKSFFKNLKRSGKSLLSTRFKKDINYIETSRKQKVPFQFLSNFFWLFSFIALILNVYFAVQLSSMGGIISDLEKEKQVLEKDINLLSENIFSELSLTKLNEKSYNMGYKSADKIFYLKSDDAFAKAK